MEEYHEFAFAVRHHRDFANLAWIFMHLIPGKEVYIDYTLPRLASKCNEKEADEYETMIKTLLDTETIIHTSFKNKPRDMVRLN
jgi:hypothetical protein